MKIDIVTIFPGMFEAVLGESIIKRARKKKLIEIKVHNLRDYTLDKHRKVDDRPFGGGPGMVMNAQPFFDCVKKLSKSSSRVISLSPQGKKLNVKTAKRISKCKHLILLCGHYEGIDERVNKYLVDEEISIGDYILTGGELPAMVLIDALARLIPGVLGHKDSNKDESFHNNLLEYPQYTRPANFRGKKVPKVLLDGNHKEITEWRRKEAVKNTKRKRKDLLKG